MEAQVIIREIGKELVKGRTVATALKILTGVGIGVVSVKAGAKKKEEGEMFGDNTEVKDNKKIAIIGIGMAIGATVIVAAKNAVPRIIAATKVAAEVWTETTENGVEITHF
ncbi:MAG: hypothetical protein K0R00_129 [Herbinix sp.]|jgi:lactate dehydrogenase-like 2-hydroxyacid dehydrogenase|nr:hypothetical protein [Herbinix sp.]